MKITPRSILLALTFLCLAAVESKVAAVSPPPDGGYPGGNTAEGTDALLSRTSGVWNTALGAQALNKDTTGGGNTATGFQSLFNNTTGNQNTAYGSQSLNGNHTGNSNTANGYRALYTNDSGTNNTANGAYALYYNAEGGGNTAIGYSALFSNDGPGNTAIGYQALFSNGLEGANTAIGYQALYKNTGTPGSGFSNTAAGYQTLFSNATGDSNTASGEWALYSNTSGGSNVASGFSALYNNSTGLGNLALGYNAGLNLTTGDYNIDIGNAGVAGDDQKIRIGEQGLQTVTYIAGISGVAIAGDPVIVNSSGQLGVGTSSKRFKHEIKPMGDASEAVLALKPVTFRYKDDLDPKRITRFGLLAEEVQKVHPDLVACDPKGEPYTVRYDAVNAMLLNEFIKEHRKVETQEATNVRQRRDFEIAISQLKKEIETLAARLKEQDANIQNVSAQLALK